MVVGDVLGTLVHLLAFYIAMGTSYRAQETGSRGCTNCSILHQ